MSGLVSEMMQERTDPADAERASCLKTLRVALAAAAGAAVCVGLACLLLQGGMRTLVATAFALVLFSCCVVSCGGLVVLRRLTRDRAHLPDLFYVEYDRIPHANTSGLRRLVRRFLGRRLRPGDYVTVRTAAEIAATLDDRGMLDALPFLPEMVPCCGRTFMVDRRIDKINDWIGGSELRRVDNVVALVDVRCNGEAHGGCEAACQLLWNERWLRAVDSANGRTAHAVTRAPLANPDPHTAELTNTLLKYSRAGSTDQGDPIFMCQITELPRVSAPMPKRDIRQDLRPLLSGNIGLRGFLIYALSHLFNWVQALRGGVTYPESRPQLSAGPTPARDLGLTPGDLVRVRSREQIAQTLFKNHNRGMWFGQETARHCNQEFRVRSRVSRIIEERSGKLRTLSIPVITLEGVTGSGEYVRLCPQNDYVFWREIWLDRVASEQSKPAGPATSSSLSKVTSHDA